MILLAINVKSKFHFLPSSMTNAGILLAFYTLEMENQSPTLVKLDEEDTHNTYNTLASNFSSGDGGAQNVKWTDDAIRKLIKLWGERPSLYDTKNDSYFSKNKRREAMEELCDAMQMGMQDIQQKMISLRTYYGSQHRKKLAWDNDPCKQTPFTSRWQFWIPLQFLHDHMTQKQSDSRNQTIAVDNDDSYSPEMTGPDENEKDDLTNGGELRSKGIKRKALEGTLKLDNSFHRVELAEKTVHKQLYQGLNEVGSCSSDELFAGVLLKSLAKIEEGEAKEALKLEIQNLVFRTRFGPQRFLVSHDSTTSNLRNSYYSNEFYSDGNELGSQANTNRSNDDEPAIGNRRKSKIPMRSGQIDAGRVRESCSMVAMPHKYTQSDNAEIQEDAQEITHIYSK